MGFSALTGWPKDFYQARLQHRDRQIAPSADFVVPIVQHRRSDRCRYVRDPKCQSTLIRTDLESVRYPICATLSRL